MKTSGCVFIKNNIDGAYCLFESMASMLPLVDEMIIMDMGSEDGTKRILEYIVHCNPKINLIFDIFPDNPDANDFAVFANKLIQSCTYDRVLYWQADEIWHEDLIAITKHYLDKGADDLKFWRIQYRENWQKIKWLPHFVHRLGRKSNFNFVGDGMNTDRYLEPKTCGAEVGFTQWGEWNDDPEKGPSFINKYTTGMITDVSQVGAFRDNITMRRAHHAPFWHESVNIEGKSPQEWQNIESQNPNWIKQNTSFNIPHVLKWHLGKTRYEARRDLIDAIANNDVLEFIGVKEI